MCGGTGIRVPISIGTGVPSCLRRVLFSVPPSLPLPHFLPSAFSASTTTVERLGEGYHRPQRHRRPSCGQGKRTWQVTAACPAVVVVVQLAVVVVEVLVVLVVVVVVVVVVLAAMVGDGSGGISGNGG